MFVNSKANNVCQATVSDFSKQSNTIVNTKIWNVLEAMLDRLVRPTDCKDKQLHSLAVKTANFVLEARLSEGVAPICHTFVL